MALALVICCACGKAVKMGEERWCKHKPHCEVCYRKVRGIAKEDELAPEKPGPEIEDEKPDGEETSPYAIDPDELDV